MSKFGTIVVGPAGAGKSYELMCLQSTFCAALITHLQLNRRSAFYVNLDPAAESFEHTPDLDIRDIITLKDVMEEEKMGPNGGLIYCFQYLMDNLDWLTEGLESLTEEYLVIFDMPGQIEFTTHIPILPNLIKHLTQAGSIDMRLAAVYLLDATFMIDRPRFFAGTLSALSAMFMLALPHLNVLSKMDLARDQVKRRDLKRFITANPDLLDDDPTETVTRADKGADADGGNGESRHSIENGYIKEPSTFQRLNRAVAGLIESYGMVNFLKLDVTNPDSVAAILSHIDDCIQYHEAQEPREPNDEAEVDEEDD